MNPKTALDPVEALEQALRFYMGICGNTAHSVTRTSAQQAYAQASTALEALTAARSAAEAVPVAWMYDSREINGLVTAYEPSPDSDTHNIRPLYAHPVPAKRFNPDACPRCFGKRVTSPDDPSRPWALSCDACGHVWDAKREADQQGAKRERAEAAIDFALKVELYKGEGDIFLRLWRAGNYQKIAEDFPEFKGTPAPAAAVEGRHGAVTDANRYRRLCVIGCAPYGSENLDQGTVIRFQSLDAFIDADIKAHSSRGEIKHSATPPATPGLQWEAVAEVLADELRDWTERGGSALDRECLAVRSVRRQIAALLPEPQRAEFVKAAGGAS